MWDTGAVLLSCSRDFPAHATGRDATMRTTRLLATLYLFIHLALLAACAPGDLGEEGGTTFTDSAGIRIAHAETPLWGPGTGWRFTEEPTLRIGTVTGPEPVQFTDVVGAVRTGGGRVVVADQGASELRVFEPYGGFLFRIGRNGEGPGEFRRLEYVGAFGGDSLVTFDSALRRIQIFSPDGEFVRSQVLETMGEARIPDKVIGLMDNALAIRYLDFGTEVPNGIVRWPHEIVARLDLDTGRLDSLARVPGSEASVVQRPNGGYSHGVFVFGKGNEFSVSRDRLALVSTDTFSVRMLDPDGQPLLTLRREVEALPVTNQVVQQYVEGAMAVVFPPGSGASEEDMRLFRQNLYDRPRATTLPVLRSIHLDTEGNLWVEPEFLPGETPPPWQVFRSDGTWLGAVTMPPDLDRGFIAYQAPCLQIGSDFLLGVFTDEMGVEYVRMYDLVKGE